MEWTHLVIITLIYVHEPKSLTGAIECEIPDYAYSEKRRKNQCGDEDIKVNRLPEDNNKNPFCNAKLLNINTRKKCDPLSRNDKEDYSKFVDLPSRDLRFINGKNFFLNKVFDVPNNKSNFHTLLERYEQNYQPMSYIPFTVGHTRKVLDIYQSRNHNDYESSNQNTNDAQTINNNENVVDTYPSDPSWKADKNKLSETYHKANNNPNQINPVPLESGSFYESSTTRVLNSPQSNDNPGIENDPQAFERRKLEPESLNIAPEMILKPKGTDIKEAPMGEAKLETRLDYKPTLRDSEPKLNISEAKDLEVPLKEVTAPKIMINEFQTNKTLTPSEMPKLNPGIKELNTLTPNEMSKLNTVIKEPNNTEHRNVIPTTMEEIDSAKIMELMKEGVEGTERIPLAAAKGTNLPLNITNNQNKNTDLVNQTQTKETVFPETAQIQAKIKMQANQQNPKKVKQQHKKINRGPQRKNQNQNAFIQSQEQSNRVKLYQNKRDVDQRVCKRGAVERQSSGTEAQKSRRTMNTTMKLNTQPMSNIMRKNNFQHMLNTSEGYSEEQEAGDEERYSKHSSMNEMVKGNRNKLLISSMGSEDEDSYTKAQIIKSISEKPWLFALKDLYKKIGILNEKNRTKGREEEDISEVKIQPSLLATASSGENSGKHINKSRLKHKIQHIQKREARSSDIVTKYYETNLQKWLHTNQKTENITKNRNIQNMAKIIDENNVQHTKNDNTERYGILSDEDLIKNSKKNKLSQDRESSIGEQACSDAPIVKILTEKPRLFALNDLYKKINILKQRIRIKGSKEETVKPKELTANKGRSKGTYGAEAKLTHKLPATDKREVNKHYDNEGNKFKQKRDDGFMQKWLQVEKEYRSSVDYKDLLRKHPSAELCDSNNIITKKKSKTSPLHRANLKIRELENHNSDTKENIKEAKREKRDIKCSFKLSNDPCPTYHSNLEKLKEINFKIENKKCQECPTIKETFIEMTLKKDPTCDGSDKVTNNDNLHISKSKMERSDEMGPFSIKLKNHSFGEMNKQVKINGISRMVFNSTGTNGTSVKNGFKNNLSSIFKNLSDKNHSGEQIKSRVNMQSQTPGEGKVRSEIQSTANGSLDDSHTTVNENNEKNNFLTSLNSQRSNISRNELTKNKENNITNIFGTKGKNKGTTILPSLPLLQPLEVSNCKVKLRNGCSQLENPSIAMDSLGEKLSKIVNKNKLEEELSKKFVPLRSNFKELKEMIYNKQNENVITDILPPDIDQLFPTVQEKLSESKTKDSRIKTLLENLKSFNENQNLNLINHGKEADIYIKQNKSGNDTLQHQYYSEAMKILSQQHDNLPYRCSCINEYGGMKTDESDASDKHCISQKCVCKQNKMPAASRASNRTLVFDWASYSNVLDNLQDVSNKLTLPIVTDILKSLIFAHDNQFKNSHNNNIDTEQSHLNHKRSKRNCEHFRNYELERRLKPEELDKVKIKSQKRMKFRRNGQIMSELQKYSKKKNYKIKPNGTNKLKTNKNLKLVHPFFFSDDVITINVTPMTKKKPDKDYNENNEISELEYRLSDNQTETTFCEIKNKNMMPTKKQEKEAEGESFFNLMEVRDFEESPQNSMKVMLSKMNSQRDKEGLHKRPHSANNPEGLRSFMRPPGEEVREDINRRIMLIGEPTNTTFQIVPNPPNKKRKRKRKQKTSGRRKMSGLKGSAESLVNKATILEAAKSDEDQLLPQRKNITSHEINILKLQEMNTNYNDKELVKSNEVISISNSTVSNEEEQKSDNYMTTEDTTENILASYEELSNIITAPYEPTVSVTDNSLVIGTANLNESPLDLTSVGSDSSTNTAIVSQTLIASFSPVIQEWDEKVSERSGSSKGAVQALLTEIKETTQGTESTSDKTAKNEVIENLKVITDVNETVGVQSTERIQEESKYIQGTERIQDDGLSIQGTERIQDEGKHVQGTERIQDEGKNVQGTERIQDEGKNVQGTERVPDEGKNIQGTERIQDEGKNITSLNSNEGNGAVLLADNKLLTPPPQILATLAKQAVQETLTERLETSNRSLEANSTKEATEHHQQIHLSQQKTSLPEVVESQIKVETTVGYNVGKNDTAEEWQDTTAAQATNAEEQQINDTDLKSDTDVDQDNYQEVMGEPNTELETESSIQELDIDNWDINDEQEDDDEDEEEVTEETTAWKNLMTWKKTEKPLQKSNSTKLSEHINSIGGSSNVNKSNMKLPLLKMAKPILNKGVTISSGRKKWKVQMEEPLPTQNSINVSEITWTEKEGLQKLPYNSQQRIKAQENIDREKVDNLNSGPNGRRYMFKKKGGRRNESNVIILDNESNDPEELIMHEDNMWKINPWGNVQDSNKDTNNTNKNDATSLENIKTNVKMDQHGAIEKGKIKQKLLGKQNQNLYVKLNREVFNIRDKNKVEKNERKNENIQQLPQMNSDNSLESERQLPQLNITRSNTSKQHHMYRDPGMSVQNIYSKIGQNSKQKLGSIGETQEEAQKCHIQPSDYTENEKLRASLPKIDNNKNDRNKNYNDEIDVMTTLRNDMAELKNRFDTGTEDQMWLTITERMVTQYYSSSKGGKEAPILFKKIKKGIKNVTTCNKVRNSSTGRRKGLYTNTDAWEKLDQNLTKVEKIYDNGMMKKINEDLKKTIDENFKIPDEKRTQENPNRFDKMKKSLMRHSNQRNKLGDRYNNQKNGNIADEEEKRINMILSGIISRYKGNMTEEPVVEGFKKRKKKKYQFYPGIFKDTNQAKSFNCSRRYHNPHHRHSMNDLIQKGIKKKAEIVDMDTISEDKSSSNTSNNGKMIPNNMDKSHEDVPTSNGNYINNTHHRKKKKKEQSNKRPTLKRKMSGISATREQRSGSNQMESQESDKYLDERLLGNLKDSEVQLRCEPDNDEGEIEGTSTHSNSSREAPISKEQIYQGQKYPKQGSNKTKSGHSLHNLQKLLFLLNNGSNLDSINEPFQISLKSGNNGSECLIELKNKQVMKKKQSERGSDQWESPIPSGKKVGQKDKSESQKDNVQIMSRCRHKDMKTKNKNEQPFNREKITNEATKLFKLEGCLNRLNTIMDNARVKPKSKGSVITEHEEQVNLKTPQMIDSDLKMIAKNNLQKDLNKEKSFEEKEIMDSAVIRRYKTMMDLIKEFCRERNELKCVNNQLNSNDENVKSKTVGNQEGRKEGEKKVSELFKLLQNDSILDSIAANSKGKESYVDTSTAKEEIDDEIEDEKPTMEEEKEESDKDSQKMWDDVNLIQFEDDSKTEQTELKKNREEEEKQVGTENKDEISDGNLQIPGTAVPSDNTNLENIGETMEDVRKDNLNFDQSEKQNNVTFMGVAEEAQHPKYQTQSSLELKSNIKPNPSYESSSESSLKLISHSTLQPMQSRLESSTKSYSQPKLVSKSQENETISTNVPETIMLPLKFNTNEFMKLINSSSSPLSINNTDKFEKVDQEVLDQMASDYQDDKSDEHVDSSTQAVMGPNAATGTLEISNRYYITYDSLQPNLVRIQNISVMPLIQPTNYVHRDSHASILALKKLLSSSVRENDLPKIKFSNFGIVPNSARNKIKGQIKNLEKVVFLLRKPLNFNKTHQVPRVMISLSELKHRTSSKATKLQHRKHYLVQVDPVFMTSKYPINDTDYTDKISKVVRKAILYGFKTPKIAKWLNTQQIG